jgi:hypothetical protein
VGYPASIPGEPDIEGSVTIEWPAKAPSGVIPGWGVSIYDAVTGKQVTTASHADIVIHADAQDVVTADLTLFCDEAGNPVFGAGFPAGVVHVRPDEGIATGTFTFLVTEMRIRN